MKIRFTFFLLFAYSLTIGQIPKTKEVHQFFQATIESIKSADTTAFIKLWSQSDYLTNACCGNIDSIATSEIRRIDFRKICSFWKPYINDLDFDIDCYEKNKKKVLDEEYGYEFIICIKSKGKPKKQVYKHIRLSFILKNGRLFCTNLLPDNILIETNSH